VSRRAISVGRIGKAQSGTVAVRVRGQLLDLGRPRISRFPATQKPFTVLKPFKLLGRRQPERRRR
jgi:hypothetical protein